MWPGRFPGDCVGSPRPHRRLGHVDEMNDPELFDRARRILRWAAIALSVIGWAIAGAVVVLLVAFE